MAGKAHLFSNLPLDKENAIISDKGRRTQGGSPTNQTAKLT